MGLDLPPVQEGQDVTIDQARALLDSASAGLPVSRYSVTQALICTGDLSPFHRRQRTLLDAKERREAAYQGRKQWLPTEFACQE